MSDTAPQGDAPAQDTAPAESNIVSEPNDAAQDLPNEHPGVEDGTVLDTTTHDGQDVKERVVYDYAVDENGEQLKDGDGNPVQIGWHKELVSE